MKKLIRIQRSRKKGFILQNQSPDKRPVVYVGRPSIWGNPYKDKNLSAEEKCSLFRDFLLKKEREDLEKYLKPLENKHLACWCPPGYPCHADVLVEFLNSSSIQKAED